MTDPIITYNYVLGLKLVGGEVGVGPEGLEYSFSPTSLYSSLSGRTATATWYVYDSLTETYEEVTGPGFTASIVSASISNGDPEALFQINNGILSLSGNFSNITFPGNEIKGVYHNGVRQEYIVNKWGDEYQVQGLPNFDQLDAITKFKLDPSPPKPIKIIVSVTGSRPTGITETEIIEITQSVANISLDPGSLSSYIGQTYFGRKIFPINLDGTPNKDYFDGNNYVQISDEIE